MNDMRPWVRRLGPLAALAILALAVVVPQPAGVETGAGGSSRSDAFVGLLDGLPDGAAVLVAFDPDLGTYAEIRPTVRGLLADLLDRGIDLAFVSLTPEGRALASIEIARLAAAGVDAARVTNLGFRTGAEAALLELVSDPLAAVEARGDAADVLAESGLKGLALTVVVGGNDLGPRSWIEQVRTRIPTLRVAAVTPTVLLPELNPYLGAGQLDGLLGTVADGAAYRVQLAPGVRTAAIGADAQPMPLALLAGMLLAAVILAQSAAASVAGAMRGLGRGS
jgi:hypothetical protein